MINEEKAIEIAKRFAKRFPNWDKYNPSPNVEHILAQKFSLVGITRSNGLWSITFIYNQSLMKFPDVKLGLEEFKKTMKKYRCIQLCVDDESGDCWESGTLDKY